MAKQLNERQKRFAEYYAQSGNILQSALRAGYSENYANKRGHELLDNVGIAEYIKSLTDPVRKQRILTAQQRQEILSEIALDEEAARSDRIKAIDTLNKMTGEYAINVNGMSMLMFKTIYRSLTLLLNSLASKGGGLNEEFTAVAEV